MIKKTLISLTLLVSLNISANEIPKETPANLNMFKIYVSYLKQNKNINLRKISKLLNSRDKYVGYYEAFVKSTYKIYKEGKITKRVYRFNELLHKTEKPFDTIEGFILMDIDIALGKKEIKQQLSSPYFCKTSFRTPLIQNACIKDYIYVECLNDEKNCIDIQMKYKKLILSASE